MIATIRLGPTPERAALAQARGIFIRFPGVELVTVGAVSPRMKARRMNAGYRDLVVTPGFDCVEIRRRRAP